MYARQARRKDERPQRSAETRSGSDGNDKCKAPTRQRLVTENRDGDPRYLQIVDGCICFNHSSLSEMTIIRPRAIIIMGLNRRFSNADESTDEH